MKPLYLQVILYDPVSDEEYSVSDGIRVEIVKIFANNPLVGYDPLRLTYNPETDVFYTTSKRYKVSKSHYLRVGFKKANY